MSLVQPYYREFESMQETLKLFAEDVPLDTGKLKKFGPVKDFWSQKTAGKGRSTEKRYQKTRTVLIQLFRMGHDPFFLCVLSMSTTAIGGIKRIENFYKALTWWLEHEAKISKSFKDYTSQLYKEHEDFFTQNLETGQRTAADLETTPEIERTSYDQSSRQSTLSEDVFMQDNESTTIQENQDNLSNISPTHTESNFRDSAMQTLKYGQIVSLPFETLYALSRERLAAHGVHLVLPGDSDPSSFLMIHISPEAAYHIQRLTKNEDRK
ncbi:hypothetical protein TGAMA5MH_10193 [Trichoderma gamsii]|uniref:Uncharacterized protein n=1 Tax=Trichoderma gamsii TaxID=398673 RepID=A0A2K0SX86_9HYPO|nr:hypothetical protein TGAMA5MH_10193 [Trichoderma gamsii]